MENKEVLYNFYDKILNCLVINTKSMVRLNDRKGYYIPNFNTNDKITLLLIEIIKIADMFDTNNLPILVSIDNLKSYIQYLKLKFKLRKSSLKIKKATEANINYDLIENLNFVSKDLNFPFSMYEEIYDSYYKKGVEISD